MNIHFTIYDVNNKFISINHLSYGFNIDSHFRLELKNNNYFFQIRIFNKFDPNIDIINYLKTINDVQLIDKTQTNDISVFIFKLTNIGILNII